MTRTATVMTFWHFCSQVAGENTETQKIKKPPPKQTGNLNLLELEIKVGLGAEV